MQAADVTNAKRARLKILGIDLDEDLPAIPDDGIARLWDGNGELWGSLPVGEASRKRPCDDDDDDDDDA